MDEQTPDAWRKRATEIRETALSMKSHQGHREMEAIAHAYERLAHYAAKFRVQYRHPESAGRCADHYTTRQE